MMTKANAKYKTVKREANVGERILITRAVVSEKVYANGDVNTVTYVYDGDVYVKEHTRPVLSFEYEVIIEESPSINERISALETQVAELLQMQVKAVQKRKKPKHLLAHYPTPNEQRKAVIERAKAFVAEQYRYDTVRSKVSGPNTVEFIVNSEKKIVVALLRRKYVNTKIVRHKGIAKCSPDDVFNADIGKAIALGRALGLDVSEFENAPKPTEAVIGQRVRFAGGSSVRNVTKEYENYATNSAKYVNRNIEDFEIIDDTEAQY